MSLSGNARKAGVMGWPIGHARSPALHGWWLALHGIDGVYVPMAVRPEDLAAALRALPILGFAGCNLTIPHKEPALTLVDRLDEIAARVGAVNTIVIGADGSLEGRNTDGYGFIASLRAAQADWSARRGPAMVIGAGGAARAIIAALLDEGVPEIRLVNRTGERAAALAAEFAPLIRPIASTGRSASLGEPLAPVDTTTPGMGG